MPLSPMPACRAPFAETADASPEDYDRMRGINLRGALVQGS
jgi:hypothetical protein